MRTRVVAQRNCILPTPSFHCVVKCALSWRRAALKHQQAEVTKHRLLFRSGLDSQFFCLETHLLGSQNSSLTYNTLILVDAEKWIQALITSFCRSLSLLFPVLSSPSSRRDRSTSTTWRPSTTATSSAQTSSATTGRRNWSCSSSKSLTSHSSSSSFSPNNSASWTLFLGPKTCLGFHHCWTPGWN